MVALRTKTKRFKKRLKGISLVELLLSIALFSVLVAGLSSSFFFLIQSQKDISFRSKAIFLAKEGIDATQSIKKNSFASLTDGNYGLTTTGNRWNLAAGSETVDGYQRQITISTIDANTKLVRSSVSWNDTFKSNSVDYYVYLTNWERVVPLTNWSTLTQTSTLDLSGSQDGYRLEYLSSLNLVYMVRVSGTPNLATISTATLASPTLTNGQNMSNNNADIKIYSGNLMISSTNNSGEVAIYTLATPAVPLPLNNINASGSSDSTNLTVVGNLLYLLRVSGSDKEFQIFNVSSVLLPTGLGSLDFSGTPYDIEVDGNFAYISTGISNQELIIVNVSNTSSPSVAGTLDISGSRTCNAVTGRFSTNYIALGCNDGNVYIVNVTNPASPSIAATYTAGASTVSTLDIEYNSTYNVLFLGTNNSTREFQVVDVSTVTAPSMRSSIDLAGSVNDIDYDSVRNVVYLATTADSAELVILSP